MSPFLQSLFQLRPFVSVLEEVVRHFDLIELVLIKRQLIPERVFAILCILAFALMLVRVESDRLLLVSSLNLVAVGADVHAELHKMILDVLLIYTLRIPTTFFVPRAAMHSPIN